jgi:mannose-6-phosphate isomerase-like protein (cupin superfamily)
MSSSVWQVFELSELKGKVAGSDPCFFEFVRSPQLSCALYRLPAGAKDMQAPHLEDELYMVLEGRARLRIGEQEQEVGPGTVLFVSATTEHSFFDIAEDLTLVAIFGPAESILINS